ncbi:hypothetical protein [Sphingopyxis sp.]|uniref:hypothetical protein n=1 Tax=Sphingopyxis sp. TaxID=1908224 RepID=UPI003D6D6014
MAKPGNREIWENGVPLNIAWFEFAGPDAKRRNSEFSALGAMSEQATNLRTEADIPKLIVSGMQLWSEYRQFQTQLQELLLDELFNDQLHAYGFRTAPTPSRAPVRIAADSFECPDVEWRRDRITVRGYAYSEIQIIDPTKIAGWSKPRSGPKGSGDTIRAAITAIQSRGVDLSNMPRKSASGLIKQEIGQNYPNGSGLSDPNLAKYIIEICGSRRINGN